MPPVSGSSCSKSSCPARQFPFENGSNCWVAFCFLNRRPSETWSLSALEHSLDFFRGRVLGPPVVAGQVVPPDGRLILGAEFRECLDLIVGLIDRVFDQGAESMRQVAWKILAVHTRSLLSHRLLPSLKDVLAKRSVPENQLPGIMESLDTFLQYECRGISGPLAEDGYCDASRSVARQSNAE